MLSKHEKWIALCAGLAGFIIGTGTIIIGTLLILVR
jgi:hypothetical protein